jgi:NAD(P)-dependent dehydrogenase (short-subunit alcohol dehydrogenase family)
VEWSKNNIRVNSIAPGFVRTPMVEEGLKSGGPTVEEIEKKVPIGRIAEPEEIAKAALFLVSDDASYITGATLAVDGGFLANAYETA